MQDLQNGTIDLSEIELNARKLRAEMMAHGSKAMFAWVKSLFASRATGRHHTA